MLLTEAGFSYLESEGVSREAARRYGRRFKHNVLCEGFNLLPEIHKACGDPGRANSFGETYCARDILIFCNEGIAPELANGYERAQWLTKPAPSYYPMREGSAGKAVADLIRAGVDPERANPYAELNGKYRLSGAPSLGPDDIIRFETQGASFAEVEARLRDQAERVRIVHEYDRERAEHEVGRGETLWSVATGYLARMGVTVDTREIHAQVNRIAALNGMGSMEDFPWHEGYVCQLPEDPNCVSPGEVLKL